MVEAQAVKSFGRRLDRHWRDTEIYMISGLRPLPYVCRKIVFFFKNHNELALEAEQGLDEPEEDM